MLEVARKLTKLLESEPDPREGASASSTRRNCS